MGGQGRSASSAASNQAPYLTPRLPAIPSTSSLASPRPPSPSLTPSSPPPSSTSHTLSHPLTPSHPLSPSPTPSPAQVYLFFSVNASGQFSGMAQMESALDYTNKFGCWAQDKRRRTPQAPPRSRHASATPQLPGRMGRALQAAGCAPCSVRAAEAAQSPVG